MPLAMVINLYNDENEIKATFTRTFVPWRLLKEAVKLSKQLNKNDLTEDDVNDLASLVVSAFGDKFTVEELTNGADIGEMTTVLNQIIARASGGIQNPTLPG